MFFVSFFFSSKNKHRWLQVFYHRNVFFILCSLLHFCVLQQSSISLSTSAFESFLWIWFRFSLFNGRSWKKAAEQSKNGIWQPARVFLGKKKAISMRNWIRLNLWLYFFDVKLELFLTITGSVDSKTKSQQIYTCHERIVLMDTSTKISVKVRSPPI